MSFVTTVSPKLFRARSVTKQGGYVPRAFVVPGSLPWSLRRYARCFGNTRAMLPSDAQGAATDGGYVCPECVGRRIPPMTTCDSCADEGLAATMGSWDLTSIAPFKCQMRIVLDSAKYREAAIDDYKHRCDPLSSRKDIFDMCPWAVAMRRASTPELRRALLRVKKHPPLGDLSWLEAA